MIGGYIAKKGLKKVKDKVKGNKKSIEIEEENGSDDLLGLGGTSENDENSGSDEQEDSNMNDSNGPEESSTDSPEDSESSDEEKSEKGGKGNKGATPSTMSIAKVVFKSGLIIGVSIVVLCIIMSIITMFTTTTGTAVQIIDGSILTYGEATPDPNKKDGKNGKNNVQFNGDEYYTKAKMIVAAVQQDSKLKKKADKAKIPSGVPNTLRKRIAGKRGGNYHIVEVAYIFRELCLNDFYSKYKINGTYKVEVTDRFLWAEFLQENCCGSSYESNWATITSDSWLEAHTTGPDSTNYRGPFQLQNGYFNGNAYITFIPSLEKDNGNEYGIVKSGSSKSLVNKMKYNKSIRTSINISSWSDTKCYHFSDMAASANNMSFQAGMDQKYRSMRAVFKSDAEYNNSKDSMTAILGDLAHRGPGFYNFSNSGSNIVAGNSSCSTHMVIMGQLLQDGLYSEDSLSKLGLNCDYSVWDDWKPWVNKLVKKCSKSSIAGISRDGITEYLSTHAYSGNPDGGLSPFYKPLAGYQAITEAKAVVDACFDALGLQLPSNGGGKLDLKESKGEFQAFWSDKNGKTLSSNEMKSYKNTGNCSTLLQYVGTKETGTCLTGQYKNDPFAKKFGDNIGCIHYHQGGTGSSGSNTYYNLSPSGGASNFYSFCGGYTVAMGLSTMLHRYVNPAEIAYAGQTASKRNGNDCKPEGDGGALYQAKQRKLWDEQRYNGKQMFKTELIDAASAKSDKNKFADADRRIKKCLDSGGMVGISCSPPIAGGTGHYVLLRSYKGDKYFILNSTGTTDSGDKGINTGHTLSWFLSHLGGTSTYLVITPDKGYEQYISDNSISENTSGAGTSVGGGDYKYWVQFKASEGTHGNITSKCPKELSAGCFVYCMLKISRLYGAKFDATNALNKCVNTGAISSSGACLSYDGVLNACNLKGYGVDSKSIGDINYTTDSGRKKLAREIYKYQRDGKYVFVHIGKAGAGGKHHWVNMFSSDGKTIEVWDSGTWQDQGSWSKFVSYRKSVSDNYANEFRIIYKK